MTYNKPLVDTIAERINLVYLSDLRDIVEANDSRKKAVHSLLLNIKAEDFSDQDWNDALEYMCNQKNTKSNAEQVREALLLATVYNQHK